MTGTADGAAPLTLDELERWELFGATWRVVELGSARATVDMCTCTGEPVARRDAEDPAVLERLRGAPPSGG